ncbi:MAG: Mth938-like domain-containing protein [Limnohabitans sp.]
MKLQPDKSSAPLVRAHHPDWLQIDEQRFSSSVILSSMAEHPPRAWAPGRFEELLDTHLHELACSGAELVILGTGRRLRFPPAAWLAPFAERRVGLESMDTAAACRTYNILASEGRKVLAALLLEPH